MNSVLSSIIRNRRGAVCAVCVALLFTVFLILGTWSACCIHDNWTQHPLPDGTVPLVATIIGCKFLQYRDDRKAAVEAPPAPSAS